MSDLRKEVSLLIAFVDLTKFAFQSQHVDDAELASTIDEYYGLVGGIVRRAGGRVVKFIGDAALIVFAEHLVDEGVAAILSVKSSVDDLMMRQGWECRLTAKVHFGSVIAGSFGREEDERYDVIGRAVNAAAMLDSTGVTLSAAAFEKLGPEQRQHFKECSRPVTYIRVDDVARFRTRS